MGSLQQANCRGSIEPHWSHLPGPSPLIHDFSENPLIAYE
jgi:hypothetical protein